MINRIDKLQEKIGLANFIKKTGGDYVTWYFILCGLLWEFPHKPRDACVLSDKGITKVYNRDVSIISAPVSVSQPSPQHVQDSFSLHACTKQVSDAFGHLSINLFFVLESILHGLFYIFFFATFLHMYFWQKCEYFQCFLYIYFQVIRITKLDL